MPGYRPLPLSVIGAAADQVRSADLQRHEFHPAAAILVLEEALAVAQQAQGSLPGWLCGRLAALYRTVARYDDEVHLLERYRETQHTDDARTRYDARLSKARTIAERKRRTESGALSSVREAMSRPRARRGSPSTPTPVVVPEAPSFPREIMERLQNAMMSREDSVSAELLERVVEDIQRMGVQDSVPLEHLVSVLVSARDASVARSEDVDEVRRIHARYSDALVRLLGAAYCG